VKKQHEESRRARELIESQLITVREEFEHNVLLLGRKDLELHKAQDELATRTAALTKTERELGETKQSLQEEMIIRQAHAASESKLDRVASGLKTVARQGVLDIDGLFGKLGELRQFVLWTNIYGE
jgi:kinesin family member 11